MRTRRLVGQPCHASQVGVSNFSPRQLRALLPIGVPDVLQIEMHLFLQQPELRTLCEEHAILIQVRRSVSTHCTPACALQASPSRDESRAEPEKLARAESGRAAQPG